MHTDQFPTYQRECRDNNSKKLASFRLQLNTPEFKDFILAPSVGPEEIGTCRSINFYNSSPMTKGTIYYDSERVNGVFFQFADGYKQPIGLEEGERLDINFSTSNSFIGFYGIQNESFIEALGFLTQD